MHEVNPKLNSGTLSARRQLSVVAVCSSYSSLKEEKVRQEMEEEEKLNRDNNERK